MRSRNSWTISGGVRDRTMTSLVAHEDNYGCVSAMGLSFASPLGVAAGVDRNGEKIESLNLAAFGHIEIGTVMAGERIMVGERGKNFRIGINIGSVCPGMNEKVVAAYCAALRHAYGDADYICANLTSPRSGRDGNSPGVGVLIQKLRTERDICAAESGRRAPLLIKVDGGAHGDPLPVAIVESRRQELDGIVLACSCLRRISAIKNYLRSAAVISVGGVRTLEQVRDRRNAGADLVQAHMAFLEGWVTDTP